MLAELMRLKYGIAVAGSHGKTTTTSLIATVLARGGIDPTFVIGGKLNTIGANAVLGDGEFLVAEADESDGSFLKLSPTIAIITNIDLEHLDHYGTIDTLKDTFLQFANKVPFYGLAILCIEDTHIQEMMPRLEKRYTTYGTTPQADFQARSIAFNGLQTSFKLWHQGTCKGNLTLKMPGVHNVYNALAAVSVAHELAISFDVTREALSNFEGVQRRFQIRGEVGGIKILDDYAHHPSEIKATLTAAKQVWDSRTLVVFQPHRFTRTRDVRKEFLTAFYQADALVVTDIYPAGEDPIPGVTTTSLVEGIKEHGHKHVVHLPDREELVRYLLNLARPGDVVITVGAGDVWQIGEDLLERLKK
jgi:UDP-N-acetylmuramate--alanine ligase